MKYRSNKTLEEIAFQVTDALLNREQVKDEIQPSELEESVFFTLKANIFPIEKLAIHLSDLTCPKEAACGMARAGKRLYLRLTINPEKVTCERCQRMMSTKHKQS